ncbi:MAG: four helix bundle protein [Saprospiraceae bacterium]|nr:four helix bundle protein [Saprospiraceae bacterium]
MRDYTKIKAFQIADALVLEVYQITKYFPKDEIYGLSSQLRRAVISVCCNIVEGCYRSSEKEFFRYLEISFASLKESHYQFELAYRLGYIELKSFNACQNKFEAAEKVLFSLIKGLHNK